MAAREDEWAESLRRLGFFLGKFIYLCDAYEDIEQDIKKGTPNPLKQKYESIDFEEECKTILMMMMSECCKEFERLPILENVEILAIFCIPGSGADTRPSGKNADRDRRRERQRRNERNIE